MERADSEQNARIEKIPERFGLGAYRAIVGKAISVRPPTAFPADRLAPFQGDENARRGFTGSICLPIVGAVFLVSAVALLLTLSTQHLSKKVLSKARGAGFNPRNRRLSAKRFPTKRKCWLTMILH